MNMTAWMVKPRPSVTMARFTPRVRNAGSANNKPTGIVSSTPSGIASSTGKSRRRTNDPGDERARPRQCPLPERELPAYPVSTTIDSTTIAEMIEMYVGRRPESSITLLIRNEHHRGGDQQTCHADAPGAELREPFADVAPQRQTAAADDEHEQDQEERDRALDAGELTRRRRSSGCRGGNASTAASPIPTTKPPSRVSGNDRKPPSSAAAIAVTVTMSVKVSVDRPVSGVSMIRPCPPARPRCPR